MSPGVIHFLYCFLLILLSLMYVALQIPLFIDSIIKSLASFASKQIQHLKLYLNFPKFILFMVLEDLVPPTFDSLLTISIITFSRLLCKCRSASFLKSVMTVRYLGCPSRHGNTTSQLVNLYCPKLSFRFISNDSVIPKTSNSHKLVIQEESLTNNNNVE